MIIVTRLDGARLAINQDHIERIEETPTTVIKLANGNSYTVRESLDDVIEIVVAFRHRMQHGFEVGVSPLSPRRLGIVAPLEED